MKLTLQLRLIPTADTVSDLLATMERFNEAASFAARVGFEAGVFSQPAIHKLAYTEIRERFGLSAQMAVRAIGKAVEVFRRDKTACPVFKPRGAVTYDERILSFKGLDKVSLWTLAGRIVVSLVYGEYQGRRFDRLKGQVDLVYRGGKFFLYATVELADEAPIEVKDWLGVDLGVTNLATDSDGHTYSGEAVEKVRRRRHESRRSYQRTGTRSAKRRLKRMARREANYRRNQNHRIANELVRLAKGTDRGIAMEDLSGIRERITVRAKDRARRSGWAFAQLQGFVCYKARLAGIPVVFVDARDTSRMCSACGHCEKANRKSRSEFACRRCGFSEDADRNAARNVRDRAVVKRPDLVASDDPGLVSRAS
jgi:IS605 OrfB family transposase